MQDISDASLLDTDGLTIERLAGREGQSTELAMGQMNV